MFNKLLSAELKNEYDNLVKSDSILPIKISDFYLEKVKNEVDKIGVGGPLYRSVLPMSDKIHLKTSFETRDYVEEGMHLPIDGVEYIIQKYEDRLIFIITDVCISHCQYCFRNYNLSKFQQSSLRQTILEKIGILKSYLLKNPQIKEVIFSGGDPLSIGYDNLVYALKELCAYDVRIHTRAIVYRPDIFDDGIISLMKKYKVRLVFHINHPYEICSFVERKINLLNAAGIRLYAQFPLLRGINDSSEVLKRLLLKMDELHIRPLSIFIPDPISYSAYFRVGYSRIIEIIDDINWHSPSWINSVRFVMDTTIGKVRRENMTKLEGKRITFSRDGKEVEYFDLDDNIDEPTDIKKLLWKDYETYDK